MHTLSVICLLLVAVIAYLVLCEEVEPGCRKRHYRGCKIEKHYCTCKQMLACQNPFPYKTRNECRQDKLGTYDKCIKNHCEHDGVCLQVKNYTNGRRSFHCDCTATGYYGKTCHISCPKKSSPMAKDYPTACIYEL